MDRSGNQSNRRERERMDRSGNQSKSISKSKSKSKSKSMEGRCAISRCSQLELKRRKNETTPEECGLWSLPDDLTVDCLAKVSRLDLVALAMASKRHRLAPNCHELRTLRSGWGCVHPYVYVYMHMYPDPSPRWFVIHPVQRRLKRLNMDYYLDPAPVEGSCFVRTDWGIYVIGGLINGKPTSEVMFFDPTDHTVLRIAPMKMARSGASASCLMGESKIYVFGGCSDSADSSNWAEVYDRATGTWEFLSVSAPPKMPLKIQQSVVLDDKKHVYAVGEDSQIFNFSVTECKFEAAEDGRSESDLENKNDWLMTDDALFCRGTGGRILWRLPCDLAWNEVKGLEELQQQHIIKLFIYNHERLAIFWEARPQGPDDQQILELWYAEITFQPRKNGRKWDLWGNIEWSGAVLSSDLDPSSSSSSPSSSTRPLNLLSAVSLFV